MNSGILINWNQMENESYKNNVYMRNEGTAYNSWS